VKMYPFCFRREGGGEQSIEQEWLRGSNGVEQDARRHLLDAGIES
jgi:hypothetical protein